jgi:L-ribulose-5-phosphate 3-epimerase
VAVGGEGKHAWAPVGDGVVGWPGQIRDFLKMKYRYAISLETHWRGAGTPEASTRVSMAGLKKVLKNDGVQC